MILVVSILFILKQSKIQKGKKPNKKNISEAFVRIIWGGNYNTDLITVGKYDIYKF